MKLSRTLGIGALVLLITLVATAWSSAGSKPLRVVHLKKIAGPAPTPLEVAKTARKKKRGLTKAAVLKLVKREIAKSGRGPAGAPGPTGPTGPSGTAGTQGPTGPPPAGPVIKQFNFHKNLGSPLEVLYDGSGMRLEAECNTQLTLHFRASRALGVVHAFAVGAQGTYSLGFETEVNSAIDLFPANESQVSGKVEFSDAGGANTVTVNYIAAFQSSQGDCLFSGSVIPSS
jgi:hypothetical protein